MVPAPTITSGTLLAMAWMHSSARGDRSVSSIVVRPPASQSARNVDGDCRILERQDRMTERWMNMPIPLIG